MPGCFGNSDIDKYLDNQVNEYYDELDEDEKEVAQDLFDEDELEVDSEEVF